MVGNRELVTALARMKSYHDYGTFTPIQVASIIALEGPQECVEQVRRGYESRRDVLAAGLIAAGWKVGCAPHVKWLCHQLPRYVEYPNGLSSNGTW